MTHGIPAAEDEELKKNRELGCTCYAHQWGWHAGNCPLYVEGDLPCGCEKCIEARSKRQEPTGE